MYWLDCLIVATVFIFGISEINTAVIYVHGYNSIELLLIAPILEETCRTLSLLISPFMGMMYTGTIVVFEFVNYMFLIPDKSLAFIFMRILCGILHLTTFWIQYETYRMSIQTKNKIYVVIGLIGAISLHILWNGKISLGIYNLIR